MSSLVRRVVARFKQDQGLLRAGLNRNKEMTSAVDLSSPAKAADYLRSELRAMFPQHYVKVHAERGVGIEVARMDDESYAKKQLTEGYSETPPNLRVLISLAPGFGASGWTSLSLTHSKNPELAQAGIKPIRRMSEITPEKGVEAILKWFKSNQQALRG